MLCRLNHSSTSSRMIVGSSARARQGTAERCSRALSAVQICFLSRLAIKEPSRRLFQERISARGKMMLMNTSIAGR